MFNSRSANLSGPVKSFSWLARSSVGKTLKTTLNDHAAWGIPSKGNATILAPYRR
jgi:hypothetical protein